MTGALGQARRPFVLGVTGNIACGKSTVLHALARLGAETIDADALYHELIAPGRPLNAELVRHFGPGIRMDSGEIDRRALGRIVFADTRALDTLDRLTHPAVVAAARERIANSRAEVVAIDAVKLYEGGLASECDAVWLVICDPKQERERLMRRNRLSAEEAERRIAAQPPLADKLARATAVIDNSGSVDAAEARVEELWRLLPILHH